MTRKNPLTSFINALVELGFNADDSISGADCVDVVATHYPTLRTMQLYPELRMIAKDRTAAPVADVPKGSSAIQWAYNPEAGQVLDTRTGHVLATLPSGEPPVLLSLLAGAELHKNTASVLRSQMGELIAAFEGEEDSVQDEHRELIDESNQVHAATETLVAPGPATPAMLRAAAARLLAEAQAMDGLSPYLVVHQHKHGESNYVAWAAAQPNEEQAAAVLHSEFEPDLNEYLNISGPLDLAEITGTDARAIIDVNSEDQDDDESPAPGMA